MRILKKASIRSSVRPLSTFNLTIIAASFTSQIIQPCHSFLQQHAVMGRTVSNENRFNVIRAGSRADKCEPGLTDFKHVKGIIFDVDGTLADSWKLGWDSTAVVLEKHKIPQITAEIYNECTKYATPERLARHAGLEPGHPDFISMGQQLAQEFDDLYIGLVTTETAGFFEGIHELILGIPPGIKLGALTNAAARYAHAVLRVNSPTLAAPNSSSSDAFDSIYARFQSIRGADDVPKPKPAPDGLLELCQELDLQPNECVYIGDSPSDAVAAQGAGMPSIAVLWGSHAESSLRNGPFSHFCRSVEELKSLLPTHDKSHSLSIK